MNVPKLPLWYNLAVVVAEPVVPRLVAKTVGIQNMETLGFVFIPKFFQVFPIDI